MKQWYEKLFENYANTYEQESYIQGTEGECDFLEKEISHNKNTRILDIGCGTGRHAIALARRGYSVTGVDLSAKQLKRAQENAEKQNLDIKFLCQDARSLFFDNEFDLVIMLCEGAFPLMETDEMNYEILKNAEKALTEKGKLIFTTLNGLFPLFHSVKEFISQESNKGISAENTFDLLTFRDHSVYETEDDDGHPLKLQCNERYYVPSEITWLLKSLHFKTIDILGARMGAFSRNDPLSTDDFEMLVVAEKH